MENSEQQDVNYLPYHAINEFMLDEYRLEVISTALRSLPKLPEAQRHALEAQIRYSVQVPGFRNSAKAPPQMKVKPAEKAFEKNPALAAGILAAWAEARSELRQQTYDLLIERGFEILPLEADRASLPGWLTVWPKDQDFDAIYSAYSERYPDAGTKKDDVSLMAIWLSGRLPYQIEGQEETESGKQGTASQDSEAA